MATISDRLKSLRNKKKLSQNDLALSLGIKRHTISAYETGSITPPIDKLILISNYYSVSLDYLCGISDNPIINNSKIDDSLGFDIESISKIQQLKTTNNMQLLISLLKYGDIELFNIANKYLNKEYDDDTKQKIDEYVVLEKIKDTFNKCKNITK